MKKARKKRSSGAQANAKSIAKPSAKKAARQCDVSHRFFARALENVWPQERDFMARPDRLRYVRKMIKNDGCVFCEAARKGVSPDSLCIYKNDLAMIVLNKFPYNSGHVLILPTRHTGDLSELTDDEFFEIQRLIRRTVRVIQKEYRIEGLNIGLNMGAIAGAGIPEHLHWHVIPRWHGDTNFFPLIAETKVLAQTVEQVYERYSKYDFSVDK
jgi:ATP adenylyltransferase